MTKYKGMLGAAAIFIASSLFSSAAYADWILDAENSKGKPSQPPENVMINELIREYLEFNGYYNSASVFITESGQPIDPPFDRNYMERKL